jgi:2-polyprenyl-3-methyl-5-hydroxy-6-metoxy-1,4-benzoquinol methylase
LAAIWGFSDFFAWGLVTANPYAVKALQNATTRRCDPQRIEKYARVLYDAGAGAVPYVEDKQLHVDYTQSIIDTDFHISHDSLEESIDRARNGRKWRLGNLHEGQEWFAFTFKEQPVDEDLTGFVRLQLADSDELLQRVYEGMSLDERHIWTRHDDYEVEFIVRELCLSFSDHVLDLGCGKGRLTMKLAELGFAATGVDFVPSWVEFAKGEAIRRGLQSAQFFERDARKKSHGAQRFDAGICLYDVVGSYASNEENQRILQAYFESLRPGARALLSVMNMTLTERRAKHRAVVEDDPVSLMNLEPSKLMQDSGEVLDPDYYLVDTKTRIVYRKEQFDLEGRHLPAELIVRDRRYTQPEIAHMAEAAGFELLWARHVRAGHWDEDLGEASDAAKEILLLLKKPKNGLLSEGI